MAYLHFNFLFVMKKIDFIHLFPEYASVSKDCIDRPSFCSYHRESLELDPVLVTIYAADPVTGIPRSDLQVIMSKDASLEVSQFIRDTLLQPSSSPSVSTPDADFALEATKSRYESVYQYADKLKSIISKYDHGQNR